MPNNPTINQDKEIITKIAELLKQENWEQLAELFGKHTKIEQNVEYMKNVFKSKHPLLWAAENGYTEIVDSLLQANADFDNIRDKDGNTALHLAAKGHPRIVNLLVLAGANPLIKNKDGKIALEITESIKNRPFETKDIITLLDHQAAKYQGYTKHAEALEQSIIKNANNMNLHVAVEKGYIPIVDLLLKAKVGLNIQDKNGNTALHIASSKGYSTFVHSLLSAGANPNIQNKDLVTPLLQAASKNVPDSVRYLMMAGANPNIQGQKGNVALHYAAENGNKLIVKYLLDGKADPNAQNDDYKATPLRFAVEKGHIEVVELLLKSGANPNIQDDTNKTSLHHAARKNNLEIVKLLLKKGATLDTKDVNGRTPLDIAKNNGFKEIAEHLEKSAPSNRQSTSTMFQGPVQGPKPEQPTRGLKKGM